MPDSSPVDTLDRALTQATRLASSVTGAQLDQPTPCSDWTVRDLLRHMVGGMRSFRGVVEGDKMSGFDVEVDDANLSAAYRDGAAALIAAWRQDGALDRRMTMFGGEMPATFPLNLQITETAIHSWDLATATAQQADLDPAIAEAALAFSEANMGPERRGAAFGPVRPAPAGAGAYERLAAFTGREVAASA
jgi:uncharacterized protein (TIGR03086 family)